MKRKSPRGIPDFTHHAPPAHQHQHQPLPAREGSRAPAHEAPRAPAKPPITTVKVGRRGQ